MERDALLAIVIIKFAGSLGEFSQVAENVRLLVCEVERQRRNQFDREVMADLVRRLSAELQSLKEMTEHKQIVGSAANASHRADGSEDIGETVSRSV